MLLAVWLLLLTGCSRDDDAVTGLPDTTATPTSPPSEPPTTPSATIDGDAEDDEGDVDPHQAAVLAAYQGYWDAILAANDPPDESHPDLRRYATGEAFESVFEAAQTNRLAGRALRLPEGSVYEHRAEVVATDGDEATVRDCAIDDGLVVDVETGEVVNDAVVTRLATATLVRDEGQWKVAHTRVEDSWEGVAGCALD